MKKWCAIFIFMSLPLWGQQSTYGEKMENKRVLISGAGPAGLTLSYWLKQYGFVPTLVERHPALRTGGYKIDIRGCALDVVKRMGAYSSILEAKTDIRGATIVDSTGTHVTNMSADTCGGRVEGDLEIMRGDLCEILWDQIGEVECLFGDCITQISQEEEGVLVSFEKNGSRRFDFVVGADGLHSTVRKLAFGEESNFLKELGLYISVYTIPNFLHLDLWEIEYFESQKFINVYSSHGTLDAKAGFAFSSKSLYFDPHNRSEQQKLLKQAFSDVKWEAPQLLALMKDAPDFYFDCVAQIQMPKWSNGRIALVGDAGYAPSPVSGQGTSLAIVGAYILAGELAAAKGDHKIAFSEYEKVLRPFAKKNQDLAKMSVALMGEKDSWMGWLHHHLMRWMPASWVSFFKKWGVKRIHEAANDMTLKTYP